MRDRYWIVAGLVFFLALFSYPTWSRILKHRPSEAQRLILLMPAHATHCVMPVTFMRADHMKLLIQWRNEVVREDIHTFKGFDGTIYDISLTNTCLKCHSKTQFCDRCHTYAGVRPLSCWSCHITSTSRLEASK